MPSEPRRVYTFGPPGTGKSTWIMSWLIRAVETYGTDRVAAVTYTRSAAQELKDRVAAHFGRDVKLPFVGTIHSLAYGMLHSPQVVDGRNGHFHEFAAEIRATAPKAITSSPLSGGPPQWWSEADVKAEQRGGELLSFRARLSEARHRMIPIDHPDLGAHFGLSDPDRLVELAHAYAAWKRRNQLVDYEDLLEQGAEHSLPIKVLLCDECLPYKTPVHLADGSSLPIGDIVEQQIPAEVLTYGPETGSQHTRRVTGWHKILNQKPLVLIRVQLPYMVRHGKKNHHQLWKAHVVCTADHPVWADEQWRPAGEVRPGMRVQVETAALRTQTYKIGSAGRRVVAHTMAEKNANGVPHNNGRIVQRGGNGHELPLAQQVLLTALGEGWESEFVVPTKVRRGFGYPTAYKIDLAFPARKIAVEVDGLSHGTKIRRAQDGKKDAFLRQRGWSVFRFSNRDAIQHTEGCVAAIWERKDEDDCPAEAVVMQVEPADIRDSYVYDISVEGEHNFYANGILVHNCQDQSALMWRVTEAWSRPCIMAAWAGDAYQSLFSFVGADPQLFLSRIASNQGRLVTLGDSHRLGPVDAKYAQGLLTRAGHRDDEGLLATWSGVGGEPRGDGSVLYLARTHFMLEPIKAELTSHGVPWADLRGFSYLTTRDGRAFRTLLQLQEGSLVSREDFVQAVERVPGHNAPHFAEQFVNAAQAAVYCQVPLSVLMDKIPHADYLHHVWRNHGMAGLVSPPQVRVSTVHGAKGREADTVNLYASWGGKPASALHTHPGRLTEGCVAYVAVSRHRGELHLLEGAPGRRYPF